MGSRSLFMGCQVTPQIWTSASGWGAVYLKSREGKNRGFVGEAEGLGSAAVEFEVPFGHQVGGESDV